MGGRRAVQGAVFRFDMCGHVISPVSGDVGVHVRCPGGAMSLSDFVLVIQLLVWV